MVEADGRNAATVERLFSRPPPVAGGPARRGGRALGVDGDGVAAVGLVEPLRAGSAMLCTQGAMGDVVAPKRLFSRPPPVAATACAAGRPSLSRRDGGERCGYRDGGGAPGMQCASIHCDIVAQRRDGGVLAVRLERRTGMCGGAVEPLVAEGGGVATWW